MRTVAAAVADLLAEAGARRCYTVPGESFLSLIDEVDRHPRLRLVSVRHESGAAFMADADARLTGVPAVAMASRGPGSSNLAIGVHTAYQDSTPMIVLLGQVDSQLRGCEAFQEVDLTVFYGPITKWAVTAERPEDVPELVARGWHIATSGRPGPVAIAIPSDFVDAELPVAGVAPPPTEAELQPGGRQAGGAGGVGKQSHLHATSWREGGHAAIASLPAAVEELAGRLLAAQRPVAIAGEAARPARDLLVAAAERFGIGVCTSFRRQDAFPVDHPNFLGHLALATPDATVDAVAEADLLLVVGTRLDEVTTQRYRLPAPGCEVVPIGRYGTGGIDADPAEVLAELARWPGPARPVDWAPVHAAVDAWSELPVVNPGEGVHPAAVIAALHRTLPDDGIVTNDAGNFAAFLHRYWRFPPTTTQLAPVNGAMGYAVPAAVAAAVAAPERIAVAVVGDGGVLMTGQEIETAVRLGAPVVVLVLQNGMYGTIAMHQARDIGRTSGVEIGAVDLVRWAEGLGAAAYGVTDAAQLDDALQRAVAGRRPAVVAVQTDPEIISPTATLAGLLERVPA